MYVVKLSTKGGISTKAVAAAQACTLRQASLRYVCKRTHSIVREHIL